MPVRTSGLEMQSPPPNELVAIVTARCQLAVQSATWRSATDRRAFADRFRRRSRSDSACPSFPQSVWSSLTRLTFECHAYDGRTCLRSLTGLAQETVASVVALSLI